LLLFKVGKKLIYGRVINLHVKLSRRLAAVASMVPWGSPVADIGTDHGYLPVHLVLEGRCPGAIAVDVAEKPLRAAQHLVELLALDQKVDLRLGNGLNILQPGEAEIVCIAGMGGFTIIKMLEAAPEQLAEVTRLILQPMRQANKLRRWLVSNGWRIVLEDIVLEEGIYYEIIAAEPGTQFLSPAELEVGPMLLKNRHPMLKTFLEGKINNLAYVLDSLGNSGKAREALEKKEMVEAQLAELKKVMECL